MKNIFRKIPAGTQEQNFGADRKRIHYQHETRDYGIPRYSKNTDY